MDDVAIKHEASIGHSWPFQIYQTLKEFGVAQISYVPDAGHAQLIELSHGDRAIQTTVLTTEEEGVALSAGRLARGRPRGALDAIKRRRQLREHVLARSELSHSLLHACDDARRMGGVQPVANPDG